MVFPSGREISCWVLFWGEAGSPKKHRRKNWRARTFWWRDRFRADFRGQGYVRITLGEHAAQGTPGLLAELGKGCYGEKARIRAEHQKKTRIQIRLNLDGKGASRRSARARAVFFRSHDRADIARPWAGSISI